MKKTAIKKLLPILLTILIGLGVFGLANYIRKENIRKQEEEAALLAAQEEERRKAEEEAARIAAEEEKKRIEEDKRTRNPLTGLKMKESAIGKRPVAIMVENTPPARPQWGMDDPNYAPDIILEAEVEGGITRTMWLFSDFTSLPDIVGPIRSARPPYVLFSQLFDSIYVHWGQSDSAGSYVGASTIIAQNGVNNINQLEYRGQVELFGRNRERDVAIEHTGIVYTKNLPKAIEEYGYRTDLDLSKYTSFDFNDEAIKVSDTPCNELIAQISIRSWTKHWKYSTSDNLYHTDDFNNNLTRQNIIVLFDTTEYITKPGASFSYCNYLFAGGEGKYASQGTVMDIRWFIDKGKLVIQDTNGNEIKLNRGKTWIGWLSANYGGYVDIK